MGVVLCAVPASLGLCGVLARVPGWEVVGGVDLDASLPIGTWRVPDGPGRWSPRFSSSLSQRRVNSPLSPTVSRLIRLLFLVEEILRSMVYVLFVGRWSSKLLLPSAVSVICPGAIVLCVSCVPVAVICAVGLLRVECVSRSRLSRVPDPLAVGPLAFGVCSL